MSTIAESTSPCGDVVQRAFVQHPTLIPCGNVGLSRYPALQKCLPPGFDYHVCSVEETQTEFDHTAVCSTIRLTLKTEEEAKEWVLKTRCTPMTWRVDSKKTTTGKRTICNIVYKCQHHVRSVTANTRRSSKNTDCPAKMTLTVHRIPVAAKGRKSRSKDLHMPQYPTVITLLNIHNHDIYSTGSLKHRDVGQKAIDTLTKLFESGHTPRSALTVLQSDLQATYGDNYVHVAADRATCPDLRFCQNLYKSIRESKAECGSAEGNGMLFAPLESDSEMFEPLERDSEMFEPLERDSEVFEDAETTVQLQPLSSSTKAATEGLEGAKASDVFDREKFCSTIEKFKETVLNNEGLQGGALDMMKTLDMVTGNHSLLLSAMRRFGRYGTNGRASQSGTIAAAAQLTSIARRRVKPGGRGRLTALRPKKNVASMDHRNSYPNGV